MVNPGDWPVDCFYTKFLAFFLALLNLWYVTISDQARHGVCLQHELVPIWSGTVLF